jgi:hypothetical protein
MPKLTYGQTNLGITLPAGRYLAKFVGTEDRDPIQDSKYGRGEVARMAWVFEVADGLKKGERFAQETGRSASPKSSCARVVMGLAGGQVAVGQSVDTDQFVGRLYEVKIAVNPNSDKGNLHVADMEPRGGGETGGKPPVSPPANSPAAGPPPRRPAPSSAPQPSVMQKYWIDTGGADEVQGDGEAVRHYILEKGLKAADLMLCPVGGNEWKPASQLGFENARF